MYGGLPALLFPGPDDPALADRRIRVRTAAVLAPSCTRSTGYRSALIVTRLSVDLRASGSFVLHAAGTRGRGAYRREGRAGAGVLWVELDGTREIALGGRGLSERQAHAAAPEENLGNVRTQFQYLVEIGLFEARALAADEPAAVREVQADDLAQAFTVPEWAASYERNAVPELAHLRILDLVAS